MHENEHVELADFVPERLERRIVDESAVEFGGDDDAPETELVATTREFLESRRPTERMRVRSTDEASRIIALGPACFVVDEPRGLRIGAHARGASEPCRIDAGQAHHAPALVQIVKQRMHRVARRAERIVMKHEAVARIILDQFAWREMVLEIDDHREHSYG